MERIASHNPKVSPSFHSAARWIWTADDPAEAHVWIYARRTFGVQDPRGSSIEITADLRYFLWINGQAVGIGPPRFHAGTPTVDRYGIVNWLVEGTNVVTILVFSHGGANDLSSCMPRRGALRAWLFICDKQNIGTDHIWKVRRERAYYPDTARRGEFQPRCELFDARQSLGQPWRPDYDDSDWENATELSDLTPAADFELRDIPLFSWEEHAPDRRIAIGVADFNAPIEALNVKQLAADIAAARRQPDRDDCTGVERGLGGKGDTVILDASSLPAGRGCYVLWDFGRLWTGYPVIEISGTTGTVVDMSYAEYLKDGRLDPTKHGLQYVDRIILGKERLKHRITWPKCLRYLQVDVRSGRAVISRLALQRSTYPVEWRGSFYCSDPVLEQAWQIGAHTAQLCMEDSYMDTPWRERGAWLGDNVPEMLCNYMVFGDHALARRFLIHQARGQLRNGQMRSKYPACKASFVSTWTLTFPVSVREYARHTGEGSLGKSLLPIIRRIIKWMETYRMAEGLYGNLPLEVTAETNIYNFIDWAPVDTSGANAAWNAHAYYCLLASADLARDAGDLEMVRLCEERAARLRDAFRTLFWDERRGVYVNGRKNGRPLKRWGCQENYLAIRYGLADETQRGRIAQRLKEEGLMRVFAPRPEDYDWIIPEAGDGNWMVAVALNRYRWDDSKMVPLGTPYFAWHALEALCELGLAEEAMRFIGLHWGEFSRQGGTSTWEAWNRDHGSLSHGWGCAPAIILGKYILGVSVDNGTAADITILPQRGGLAWAQGRVVTRWGEVQVAWQWNQGWSMELALPAGASILAGLPADAARNLVLNGRALNEPMVISRFGQNYRVVQLSAGTNRLDLI